MEKSKFKERIPYLIGLAIGILIVVVFLVHGIFGKHEMGQAFKASPGWMKVLGLLIWGAGGYAFYKQSKDEFNITRNHNVDVLLTIAIAFVSFALGLLVMLNFYNAVR